MPIKITPIKKKKKDQSTVKGQGQSHPTRGDVTQVRTGKKSSGVADGSFGMGVFIKDKDKPRKKASGGKITQKKLDKAAKYKYSVAYQNKNAPKSKGMDYLKDLPGTLSKDMSQVKKIRKNAARVAAGDPIAEKKYGTGKRTGTNMDRYLSVKTDGSVESGSKLRKLTKKKSDGGKLKSVPEGKKGLSKLPTPVRNKMGFMKKGGMLNKKGKK